MKKHYLKLVLVSAACMLSVAAWAQDEAYKQDPRYGSSPEERHQNVLNLNFLTEKYKMKQYDEALTFLRPLLATAPQASQNMYIYGANIYENKIAAATSLDEKNKYIDTLMMIYDKRMENFGDHAKYGKPYITALKAQKHIQYRPNDIAGITKTFNEAYQVSGNNIDPELVILYFNAIVNAYKEDAIETDLLLNEYDRLSPLFAENVTPQKEEAKKTFEALFVSSGAANCDNLEKVFRPQVEADPNNLDLLKKVMGLLTRAKCTTPFLGEVGEKIYEVEPSSSIALTLAQVFENDPEKANKYLNDAIAAETDPIAKASLATQLAGNELANDNARAAADYAKQAIEYNPEYGPAYMMLAHAYAVGTNSCGDFSRQAAFWLVVDTLTKARSLMEGDEEQCKNIDAQIATYRGYFPKQEDIFFNTLEVGSGYTVNCGWVSGRTTVRAR